MPAQTRRSMTVKMMLPLADRARCGAAAWANRNGIRRLSATDRSHISAVQSLSGAEASRAAVTNTVSSPPKARDRLGDYGARGLGLDQIAQEDLDRPG